MDNCPLQAIAPHSSTLAWKIPWMEEPDRLQSTGLLRVGHDWVTSLSLFTFMHWRRKWRPTPVFLPGESQGRGSLVGSSMGSHRVGHYWSDLAAAAAPVVKTENAKDTFSGFFKAKPSACNQGLTCQIDPPSDSETEIIYARNWAQWRSFWGV